MQLSIVASCLHTNYYLGAHHQIKKLPVTFHLLLHLCSHLAWLKHLSENQQQGFCHNIWWFLHITAINSICQHFVLIRPFLSNDSEVKMSEYCVRCISSLQANPQQLEKTIDFNQHLPRGSWLMIAEEQDVLKSMIKISLTQAELIINFNHWRNGCGSCPRCLKVEENVERGENCL